MRHTWRERVLHIVKVTLVWMAAYLLFGFLRFYGMDVFESPGRLWAGKSEIYISQLLLAATITGLLYGIVDLLIDRPQFQRWSYIRVLFVKGTLHFFIILITISLLILSRIRLGIIEPSALQDEQFDIITNKSFQVYVVFFIVTSWLMNTFQEVNRKFGKGVFLELMLGKYHQPKQSDRIFMFVDLKSSVRLAESLGHIRYSYLLQDSYYDLNVVIDKYKARIYQYVGDQAVLHWNLRDGLESANCIRCFFAFINRLEKRRSYYERRYGFVPFFKAGAHTGRVTVAEVGVRKRSIAFHGDTVNTSSRIQDHCNDFNQRLLISEDLLELLPNKDEMVIIPIGDNVLAGKHNDMKLFAIEKIEL